MSKRRKYIQCLVKKGDKRNLFRNDVHQKHFKTILVWTLN